MLYYVGLWCVFVYCFFFFLKQKTAYVIGTGDWRADMCASDLSHTPSHTWTLSILHLFTVT